jgi:hypothetical protein
MKTTPLTNREYASTAGALTHGNIVADTYFRTGFVWICSWFLFYPTGANKYSLWIFDQHHSFSAPVSAITIIHSGTHMKNCFWKLTLLHWRRFTRRSVFSSVLYRSRLNRTQLVDFTCGMTRFGLNNGVSFTCFLTAGGHYSLKPRTCCDVPACCWYNSVSPIFVTLFLYPLKSFLLRVERETF